MTSRVAIALLFVALAGGVSLAAFRATGASEEHPKKAQASAAATSPVPLLPPNHPPIGSTSRAVVPTNDAPAIRWTDPSGWERIPNPNPMRIATYRIPGARGGDPAELTVVRAGGTLEANVQRWLGEFDDMGKETRTEMTVSGMKVTLVETSGTYLGTSMGPSSMRHAGWALLSAIVETPGPHYFFKMLGPQATVAAARPSLEALLNGITPISP